MRPECIPTHRHDLLGEHLGREKLHLYWETKGGRTDSSSLLNHVEACSDKLTFTLPDK